MNHQFDYTKKIAADEKIVAKRYLAGLIDLNDDDFFLSIYGRNDSMKKLDGLTTFVMVGCGALPGTMAFFSSLFCCRMIGVDIDPEALELAEKVMGKMQKKADFFYHLSDIDWRATDENVVVYIANLVVGKNEVLEYVYEVPANTMRVVLREPIMVKEGGVESALQTLDEKKWLILTEEDHHSGFNSKNVYLTRK